MKIIYALLLSTAILPACGKKRKKSPQSPVPPTVVNPNDTNLSYYDVLVDPIADALIDAKRYARNEDQKIYFSLQGEMGATVFNFPESYTSMADQVKSKLTENGFNSEQVKIGIGLNGDKVAGHPTEYAEEKIESGVFRLESIQKLFETTDFLATSFYPKIDEKDFTTGEVRVDYSSFDSLMATFENELKFYGIDLTLLKEQNKELHWGEFGHGFASFDELDQPWRQIDQLDAAPFKDPKMEQIAIQFYQTALDYIAESQSSDIPVSKAFIWNLNSYDVQGLYIKSQNESGESFASEGIIELLNPRAQVANEGIYSSVMLMGEWDWQMKSSSDGMGSSTSSKNSNCIAMVDRAAELNNKVVNFVINEHYKVSNFNPELRNDFENDFQEQVANFCRFKWTNGTPSCDRHTTEDLANFRASLSQCFARAMKHGMDISIIPHLDEAELDYTKRGWRNRLSFDPLLPY